MKKLIKLLTWIVITLEELKVKVKAKIINYMTREAEYSFQQHRLLKFIFINLWRINNKLKPYGLKAKDFDITFTYFYYDRVGLRRGVSLLFYEKGHSFTKGSQMPVYMAGYSFDKNIITFTKVKLNKEAHGPKEET